jgi:hypothetical protein
MVHELESAVNTPSSRRFENIGRGVLSAIKAIGAAILLSYALKSSPAHAQEDDGFATGRAGTGKTPVPGSMDAHEAEKRKAAENQKYAEMTGNVYGRIHSYMVEKGDNSTAVTLQALFDKFKASNTTPKAHYEWLTQWLSRGSYAPEELAYFLCRIDDKPVIAAKKAPAKAGAVVGGSAPDSDSGAPKKSRAPRKPLGDMPYEASGISGYVGMEMGDIEATLWGVGINFFDTDGNERFRLFYRQSQDGKIYLDEENPSEYGKQLFGLRLVAAEGGDAEGLRLDIGGDIDSILGSRTVVADPITSGPLTIDQTTEESFEDSYDRLWLKLQFPAADARINFGIASRAYEQASSQADTVRTHGDIQSSDPNFPDPIHVDRTDLTQTDATTSDNATIYELRFKSGNSEVPFQVALKWLEGEQSSTIDQTVNGAPQPTQSGSNEYGQVMVTLEAADEEGTTGGAYLIGIIDGDGIQDRHKVIASFAQAWLTEPGNMALALDAEYNAGASAGITVAGRRSSYGAMEMGDFLDVLREGREGRMPMDMMSEEGRRAFNEHMWPVLLKEGVAVQARKYWPSEGERGGELGEEGWSGNVAVAYQGTVLQYNHSEDSVETSDGVTLGQNRGKLGWYVSWEKVNKEANATGDNVESSRWGVGLKVVDF